MEGNSTYSVDSVETGAGGARNREKLWICFFWKWSTNLDGGTRNPFTASQQVQSHENKLQIIIY